MFEKLNHLVKSTKSKEKKEAVELTSTTEFVRKLKDHGYRLSYTALTASARELDDYKLTAMSPGQQGSQLVNQLPKDLQPYVCRNGGSYHANAVDKWAGEVSLKELKALPAIEASVDKDTGEITGAVFEFIEAFVESEE